MQEGAAVYEDFRRFKRTGELPDYVCVDPEGDWVEEMRAQADFLRKRGKEAA
jgi:hypothetical protein